MRGDSIRDFYAKTLALLGLGVLAGTGALVDYWPSGVAMPAVETGLVLPEGAGSLPIPSVIPEFHVRPVAPRHPSQPNSQLAVRAPAEELVPVLPVAPLVDVGFVQAVRLTRPPVAMPVEALVATYGDLHLGQEVALSAPVMAGPAATLAMASPPISLSDDEGHDGLLAGAMKRTGSSIVGAGRKTGASIVDALRAVSGAFRRAFPN